MMNGFLNLLKPPGMTSQDAVSMVRRLLPKGTRVGHGGTLDPDAAGVLPICVGKAARLFDYIIDKRKTYIAEMRLGIETDTQDATGEVIRRCDASHITGEDVLSALPAFIGEIDQIPPAYSAIKRDGVRMYDLARKGQAVALEPRRVTVYGIDYLGKTAPDRHMLSVTCGKGVYIRTLCRDIGAVMGVGAHMSFLERTAAGAFTLENAVSPQELPEASAGLEALLLPLDTPLGAYEEVRLDEQYERQILNGCPIPPEWHKPMNKTGVFRVYVGDRFAGMAEEDDGGMLRFKAMLLERPNAEN